MKRLRRKVLWIGAAALTGAALAWWAIGASDGRTTRPKYVPPTNHAENSPSTSLVPTVRTLDATARPAAVKPAAHLIDLRLARDIAAKLREWEDQDDPDLRTARTQELENLFDGADVRAVLETLPSETLDFVLGLPSPQRWMKDHPAETAAWMSAHPEAVGTARVRQLVDFWQAAEPAALRAYGIGLENGIWKEKLLAALSAQAAQNDPRAAIDWAGEMQSSGAQTGALEAAVSTWQQQDADAARAWVGQLHDQGLRERLTARLAVESAERDPAFAARWATQSLPVGETLERCLANIAAAWAVTEPMEASEWVMHLPAGRGQRLAVDQLVNVWGNLDRAATQAWIARLPDEKTRIRAASLLATLPN